MAAYPQQGSRAGLITGLVIFAIGFIVSTILAINFGVKADKAERELETRKKAFIPEYVTDATIANPPEDVAELKALRADASGEFKGVPLLEIAIKQRDELALVITGRKASVTEAKAVARQQLAEANTKLSDLKITLPAQNNLASVPVTLATAIVQNHGTAEKLRKEVTEWEQKASAASKQKEEQLAEKDKQIEAVRAEAKKSVDEANQDRASKQAAAEELEKSREAERKTNLENSQKSQLTINAQKLEIEKTKRLLEQAQIRIASKRINVSESLIRQSDGVVVRVSDSGIVFINRGQGDQISPGLTFEIYDKIAGVPLAEPKHEDELPEGKASIEVVRVNASSSECRIVRQAYGQTIHEGDLIANLIYDPHVKYNFTVYGKFDMDGNTAFTAAEGDVIKRLVTQWGAKVMEQVNVDTDFLVLGKEPVLPSYTPVDLQDPINSDRMAKAQAERDAYLELVTKARDLHIPILNQNRFLYFIGYFDQLKR